MAGPNFKIKAKMRLSSQNKSQITVLVIAGLVLLITAGLALYLSKAAIKKQSTESVKKTQETAMEIQPIKEFVVKCMDKLTKDAVLLLGSQGGYIYTEQGGTLVDYSDTDEGVFFVRHNGMDVAYNILPPRFALPPYSSEVPDYPWKSYPYKTLSSDVELFDGFFGISNMPPLNSSEGPNSVQSQIENFIDNNIASCLDFNIFREQGFDITLGQARTYVVIGSNDVSVKLEIPITVTNQATKESAELNEFSSRLNIRLRDAYFFIKEMIFNDIKNIKFDIGDQKNNLDSFNIRLIESPLPGSDLIIVTDERSLIYGKPFEYILARGNRAPALYYIKKDMLKFSHLYIINQSDLFGGSALKADDPDEDNYTFTITPPLPKQLNVPQIRFRVEVSDGKLSDYQIITVNRA